MHLPNCTARVLHYTIYSQTDFCIVCVEFMFAPVSRFSVPHENKIQFYRHGLYVYIYANIQKYFYIGVKCAVQNVT